MTSRTPIGVSSRPPQRNASLPTQRPNQLHRRTSSQQYLSGGSSPVRKDQNFTGLSGESSADTTTPGRHVATPRRGGSRLKLELPHDNASVASLSMGESPASMTPGTGGLSAHAAASEAVAAASPAVSRTSRADTENPPMPMPRRKGRPPTYVPTYRTPAAPSAAAKKDARPKPYTVQVPTAAPRLVSTSKDSSGRQEVLQRDPFSKGLFSGRADFFPWKGNHHEDEWTQETIQKGTWDKGNPNETVSAKMAITPALKQRSSLNALSTIFMGVLHQRRTRGTVTAASTFKPPPRVTLTDTKREVWLKDLANPAISLRRLSRTIPHGIRGRTLLDQCLNKRVPTERAVWLAKCVGANEIRAFKRKGVSGAFVMGGESKWNRDWTIFVEQFVEAIITNPAEDSWKDKVNYSVRLATYLYSEHLLDRDHYLDWILNGFERSPQSTLPIWILMVKIYWKDMLQARRTGKRFVSALLNHLQTIHSDPDRDILIQLLNQLTGLLTTALKQASDNFVCPSTWTRHKSMLRSLVTSDSAAASTISALDARNRRLSVMDVSATSAGHQHLVQLLDQALQGPIDKSNLASCWSATKDKLTLVKTVVEWATSSYRPGTAKTYVAANLLRLWASHRVDPTPAVLSALDDIPIADVTRKRLVYHLVAELMRSQHFFLPQYLQWLISRGGYHDAKEVDAFSGPCSTRLLVELPLHGVPDRWRTERANLLRRASYDVSAEAQDVEMAWAYTKHALGFSLPDGHELSARKPLSINKLANRLSQSTWTVKSFVSTQLAELVAEQLHTQTELTASEKTFTSIRTLMEKMEDFATLASILRSYAKSACLHLLSACADTVNVHLVVLQALQVDVELFQGLMGRLRSTYNEGLTARPLLVALSSLAERMHGHEDVSKQLHRELMQTDRSNAIDACSPISDNMLGLQAQNGNGELSEEIDKLLASGDSIDNQTMKRLFRNIVPKVEAGWAKQDDSRRVYASLLTRLRIFDTLYFDKVMADWISHVRSMPTRPPLVDLFPILVSLGCLSVSTILHTATGMAGTVSAGQASATYLQELLHLLLMKLPASARLTLDESYKFRIHQASARTNHSKALLSLMHNSVVEYVSIKANDAKAPLVLDSPEVLDAVLDALKVLVVANSAAVANAFNVKSSSKEAAAFMNKLVTSMLLPEADGGADMTVETILGLTNELTMPFCQLKLNMALAVGQESQSASDTTDPIQLDLFAKAMDRSMSDRNMMWTSMLPCLSENIAQHLRGQAHARFLELIPSLKWSNLEEDATSDSAIQLAQNLLGVLEATMSAPAQTSSSAKVSAAAAAAPAPQLSSGVVDKIQDIWGILSSEDVDVVKLQPVVLQHWLPALLRFIVLQSIPSLPSSAMSAPTPSSTAATAASTKTTPNNPSHNLGHVVLFLSAIYLHLSQHLPRPFEQNTSSSSDIRQYVFDVALHLVDSLPDDLRLQCARSILVLPGAKSTMQHTSHPRLYYLLSTPRLTPMDELMLSHKDKPGNASAAAGAGSSTTGSASSATSTAAAAAPPSSMAPHSIAAKAMGALYGIGPQAPEVVSPFAVRRWELLSEPTPNIGENDTSLSLDLFEAIKLT